jgi:hypothetical protein
MLGARSGDKHLRSPEWEIYGNTFLNPQSGNGPSGETYPRNRNYWYGERGGTGYVFNNSIDDFTR